MALLLDGVLISSQSIPSELGRLELLAEAGTQLQVNTFEVQGDLARGSEFLLATEALAGAGTGIHSHEWQPVQDEHFHFGTGFRNVSSAARAKWNYHGAGFKLYAPRNHAYTKARVSVDGQLMATIDLYAELDYPSDVIFEAVLPVGLHAVAMEAVDGVIPCDCLEIEQP
jgi:hypothetical protein